MTLKTVYSKIDIGYIFDQKVVDEAIIFGASYRHLYLKVRWNLKSEHPNFGFIFFFLGDLHGYFKLCQCTYFHVGTSGKMAKSFLGDFG